jgi:hypothetical protein
MRIQIRKTDAAVADFWGDGAELRKNLQFIL